MSKDNISMKSPIEPSVTLEQVTEIANTNPLIFAQPMLLDDRIRVARPDVFPSRCVGFDANIVAVR